MTQTQKIIIFVGACGITFAPLFLWVSVESYNIHSPMYYLTALWVGFFVGILIGVAGVAIKKLWGM